MARVRLRYTIEADKTEDIKYSILPAVKQVQRKIGLRYKVVKGVETYILIAYSLSRTVELMVGSKAKLERYANYKGFNLEQ